MGAVGERTPRKRKEKRIETRPQRPGPLGDPRPERHSMHAGTTGPVRRRPGAGRGTAGGRRAGGPSGPHTGPAAVRLSGGARGHLLVLAVDWQQITGYIIEATHTDPSALCMRVHV
ncbi:unnamed protein product [Gadus morhua 'NCC']